LYAKNVAKKTIETLKSVTSRSTVSYSKAKRAPGSIDYRESVDRTLQKINKFNTSHGEMGYAFIFYSKRVSVESHNSEKTINFALCAGLGVLEDRAFPLKMKNEKNK